MAWFSRHCFFSIIPPPDRQKEEDIEPASPPPPQTTQAPAPAAQPPSPAEEKATTNENNNNDTMMNQTPSKPTVPPLDTSGARTPPKDTDPASSGGGPTNQSSYSRTRGNRKSVDDMTLLLSPRNLDAPPGNASRRSSVAVPSPYSGPRHRDSLNASQSRKNEIDLSIAALENIMENCERGLDVKALPDQLTNVIFLLKKYKTDYEAPAVVREMKMKQFVQEQLRNHSVAADDEVRKFIGDSLFAPHESYFAANTAENTESALDFFESHHGAVRSFTMRASNADLSKMAKPSTRNRHDSLIHNASAPAGVLKIRLTEANGTTTTTTNNNTAATTAAAAVAAAVTTVTTGDSIQMQSSGNMKERLTNAERILSLPEVQEQLVLVDDWTDFDVFAFNDLVQPQPLFIMMAHLFTILGLFDHFSIKQSSFSRFFAHIERMYHSDNPYHNALHATDVVQNIYCIMKHQSFSQHISPLDVLTALVAAAVHDVGHPGTTNAFQIANGTELATLYNDKSVLENYHLAEAFRILKMDDCNIFATLDAPSHKQMRQTMIGMVLATDMQEHLHLMSELEGIVETRTDGAPPTNDRSTTMVYLRGAIHCADVANPAKPLVVYEQWVDRIIAEWYRQGDMERELAMEVSPLMDRNKPGVAKSQVGFIRFFIKPLFTVWGKLVPECREYMTTVDDNLKHYGRQVEETPNPTPTGSRRTSVEESATDVSSTMIVAAPQVLFKTANK